VVALHATVERSFQDRVQALPSLGLGLSVDLYQPDLFELMRRLSEASIRPGYLEVFKATVPALAALRKRFPGLPLTSHGEGLWVTQPDFAVLPFVQAEIAEACRQLDVLDSCWLNHECATKQMAGYSFGTYLPPLYTEAGASVVADNIALVQRAMDRSLARRGAAPLFLLELPPLTYFMAGTVPIPQFFRRVTELVPCGLVLDIGHLWTIYRHTSAWRADGLEEFVEAFLDEFPMERVVEIHVAGLARHEAASLGEGVHSPDWIDAHAAPIRDVAWSMLQQVLVHPGLVSLRGAALEVDTKPIAMIVEELQCAGTRFGSTIERLCGGRAQRNQSVDQAAAERDEMNAVTNQERTELQDAYERYARIASGQRPPDGPEWNEVLGDPAGLRRYIDEYLPHEILHWGGELTDMFPRTCRALNHESVVLNEFVGWWFRAPRPIDRPYDFFLLKIERFLEFIAERAPHLSATAEEEARVLRRAYAEASDPVGSTMELST